MAHTDRKRRRLQGWVARATPAHRRLAVFWVVAVVGLAGPWVAEGWLAAREGQPSPEACPATGETATDASAHRRT